MSNFLDPNDKLSKTENISQFSENGIFVNDDDQDWGSSGMNDIQVESE
ncbi:hypothetical protein N8084_01125 [Pelagibacteraceae bacterium]|nr:hypothetical protein [Pelagibacteraceae bacterium]